MHRNDKLVMIMNMIELESSKTANERDRNIYPKGVFCTSLTLAKVTGKAHKEVLRDIESVIEKIKSRGVYIKGESKFAPINDNQRFVISKYMYPKDRFIDTTYTDNLNRSKKMYYLDEVAYLTMMGKYNDTITYLLALFYVKTKHKVRSVYERLIYTDPNKPS